MPTDQVRGLKAHGSTRGPGPPAEGLPAKAIYFAEQPRLADDMAK